jgi:phenylalanine-4-hydroxylase
MAYRVGGLDSVLKAIECKNICTSTFSSGIQVSGVFSNVYVDNNNQIKYIQTTGPTTLSYKDHLLDGHGPTYHKDGFGAPLGQLLHHRKKLEDCTIEDLNTLGWNCKVTDTDGKCYFEPAWGTFDMAVGNTIDSVFNGTADKNIFEDQLYVSPQRTFQQNYSSKDLVYQNIFQEIRNYREQKKSDDSLIDIWKNIKNNFKEDWLAALEILELADTDTSKEILSTEIRAYLKVQIDTYPKFTKLIKDGLSIIDAKLKFE